MKNCISHLNLLKYAYTLVLLFMISVSNGFIYLPVGILEMLSIIIFTQILAKLSSKLSLIIDYILFLLLNSQLTVLYFGGSFISMVMLNNIDSIQDLSGNFYIYIPFIIVMCICTFIPRRQIKFLKDKFLSELGIILCIGIIIHFSGLEIYSSFYNLIKLGSQYQDIKSVSERIANADFSENEFYQSEIGDYRAKPQNISENPNIILIFTEGLSRRIILDERNLMPNIKSMEAQSLHFENYYNHTFATYHGLSGQLYSGFQNTNTEINLLISIQDILAKRGYKTSFINVEPYNDTFTDYLLNLNFDEVITDTHMATSSAQTISDKNAYELLFDTCMSQKQDSDSPFFTAIYTFGTHVSLDSPDEKFEDGSKAELNKFYNVDYQFGSFMSKFYESDLAENTIIIFTSDHATYVENDYKEVFSSADRVNTSIDEIPFFIYYRGIESEKIDVQGKNSLDLVPTILDYLDISEENYFLGESLFCVDSNNEYDTIHSEGLDNTCSTLGDNIEFLSNQKMNAFTQQMIKYFSAKTKEKETPYIKIEISNDYRTIEATLYNADECNKISFPMWSIANNQADIIWWEAEKVENGIWKCYINLYDYYYTGQYIIEAYNDSQQKICASTFVLDKLPDSSITTSEAMN